MHCLQSERPAVVGQKGMLTEGHKLVRWESGSVSCRDFADEYDSDESAKVDGTEKVEKHRPIMPSL